MPSQRLLAQTGMTSLAALLALAGCGEARRVIADYPVEESAAVETAPYPSLTDMPSPASLRASAPDPEEGRAIAAELSIAAAAQQAEADRLAGVVSDVAPLRAAADAARAGRVME